MSIQQAVEKFHTVLGMPNHYYTMKRSPKRSLQKPSKEEEEETKFNPDRSTVT